MARRLGLVITAIALALVLPAASAVADPSDDKSQGDERVKELQQEFAGLDEDLARVIAERDAAEAKLPDAAAPRTPAAEALAAAIGKDQATRAGLPPPATAQRGVEEPSEAGSDEIDQHKTAAARVGRQAYQNSGIASELARLLQMAERTSAD